MNDPLPRRETKKTKGQKKGGHYSAKHIRIQEALREKKGKNPKTDSQSPTGRD